MRRVITVQFYAFINMSRLLIVNCTEYSMFFTQCNGWVSERLQGPCGKLCQLRAPSVEDCKALLSCPAVKAAKSCKEGQTFTLCASHKA